MERHGFWSNGYTFKIYVPTTIYDLPNINVKVYIDRTQIADEYLKLAKMPKWDASLQAVVLDKRDRGRLEKLTDEFVKRLPPIDSVEQKRKLKKELREEYQKSRWRRIRCLN